MVPKTNLVKFSPYFSVGWMSYFKVTKESKPTSVSQGPVKAQAPSLWSLKFYNMVIFARNVNFSPHGW